MIVIRIFLALLIGIILLCIAFDRWPSFQLFQQTASFFGSTEHDSNSTSAADLTPVILAWTKFFSTSLAELDRVQADMGNCSVHCHITDDHLWIDNASAVVFHLRNMRMDDLPNRAQSQRFVFFLLESPNHSGGMLDALPRNYFNTTVSYRLDSDVVASYGSFVLLNASRRSIVVRYDWKDVVFHAHNKSRLVALFLSNCHSKSGRELYLADLQKYIQVDVFGGCSVNKSSCGSSDQCETMLTQDYLFYLAFENSICQNYITEKFWRLKWLVVPVVLRAQDYYHIAPKGSFIAADQFESPKKLTDYLHRLAANRMEYLQYFTWTKHYGVKDLDFGFCGLCTLLHNKSAPVKWKDNIKAWWIDQSKCADNYVQKNLLG